MTSTSWENPPFLMAFSGRRDLSSFKARRSLRSLRDSSSFVLESLFCRSSNEITK
jgi:hypothetical protein